MIKVKNDTTKNPKPYQRRRRKKNRWMKLEAFHGINNRAIQLYFLINSTFYFMCIWFLYIIITFSFIVVEMTSTLCIERTSKEDIRKITNSLYKITRNHVFMLFFLSYLAQVVLVSFFHSILNWIYEMEEFMFLKMCLMLSNGGLKLFTLRNKFQIF